MTYEILIDGKSSKLELHHTESGFRCVLDGRVVPVDAEMASPDIMSLLIEGRSFEIKRENVNGEVFLWVGNVRYTAEVRDPRARRSSEGSNSDAAGPKKLKAPMPGKVVRIMVVVGDAVEAGQGVIVIEAMKMQNELKSPKKGVIKSIVAREGGTVNSGDALLVVE